MEEEVKKVEEENTINEQTKIDDEPLNIKLEEAKEGETDEGYSFPLVPIIIIGVLALLIIACVIVVIKTGGPI